MSKNLTWVLTLVVIVIVAFWVYGSNKAPKIEDIVIQMSAQNDSGQNGTATISEADGKASVVLSMSSLVDSNDQPAHIHLGTCANIGGVKYPLTNIKDGSSETLLDVSIADLLSQGELAINAHKSVAEVSVYTSCGDIK